MDLNPFLPILPVPPLLPPPPEQQQSHHQIPFLPHPNLNEEIHLINQENHLISPLPPPPPPPANLQEVHIAQLATASPPKHAPTHLNHPPYAEMIIAAITSLNEKKGSSKKAIAKFIDSTYTNLPQSHSALLTHHLGRLKKNGLVIMIKHSYKLPNNKSSSSSPLPLTTTTTTSSEGSGLLGKRGRGRPPKPKSINGSILQQPKKGRGRPPKPKSINGSILQPKKGRGRPPKSVSKPIIVTGSRPRGRPRKVDSGNAILLLPGVVVFEDQNTVVGSSSTGRPVGRPRKTTVTSPSVDGGVLKPNPVTRAGGRSVGRPRKDGGGGGGGGRSSSRLAKQQPIKVSSGRPVGRPRKDGSRIIVKPKTRSISTTGRPVGRPRKDNKIRVSVSSGRPVGRPRKENGSPVGEPVKEDETRVLSRRPVGRPPKKVGVVKPIKVSTGKPVGRPRKVRIVEVPPEEMEVVGLINGVNE